MNATIEIIFSANTHAFGANFGIVNNDHIPNPRLLAEAYRNPGGGQPQEVLGSVDFTVSSSLSAFLGFLSTDEIDSVKISWFATPGVTVAMDNMSFATQFVSVPEPTHFAFIAVATVALRRFRWQSCRSLAAPPLMSSESQ